jgi:RNA polymerase sigma-70 factor (ECF subfamily)
MPMAHGELEDLFERFRAHGDLESLARVFDLTAPKLLSVARHVANGEASAEDLVQATFVAAIEHASRFDSNRELVPWLTGILANKAKLARALASRATDREQLVDREPRDPALDAEMREFVAAFQRALDAVPSKYRDVVRGHLADGKPAEQLADELGRDAGTVRVQLHRGLAMLRRALPPGFALGAAVWLGAPRGLAAVRAELLEHARMSLPVGGPSPVSPPRRGMSMELKVLSAVAISVALGWGTWLWQRDAPSEGSAAAELASSPELATKGEISPGFPSPEPDARVDAPSPPAAVQGEPYGSLDIEVVWYDGTPAANVALECEPLDESMPAHHIVEVRTDANGRASIAHVHEGRVAIRNDRTHSETEATVVGGAVHAARVELTRGVDVVGRVTAANGAPVQGATVWLSVGVLGSDPNPSRAAWPVATTSEDGRFAIRSAYRGSSIFATAPQFGASQPAFVADRVDVTAEVHTVDFVLVSEVTTVDGVVHSSEGTPVAGAIVTLRCYRAVDDAQGAPWFRTRTDAEGRYAFDSVPIRHIEIDVAANGFAFAAESRSLLAGTPIHVNFALVHGVTVRGLTTGAEGEPLAGVGIFESSNGPREFAWPEVRTLWTISRSDGTFELSGLRAGGCTLQAWADIDGNRRHLAKELTAADGAAVEWNPSFVDGLAIGGAARDPQGVPLVGWSVQVAAMDVGDVVVPQPVKTDASGAFRIRNLRDVDYRLELTQPERTLGTNKSLTNVHPPRLDLELVASAIDLTPASVTGAVVDAHGTPLAGVDVGVYSIARSRGYDATTDIQGRFRVDRLESGDFYAEVAPPDAPSFRVDVPALTAGEQRDLGVLTVGAAGRVTAYLARDDGSKLENPLVMLMSTSDFESNFAMKTDDGYHFTSPALSPGTYQLFPQATNIASSLRDVEVRADETTALDYRYAAGRLRIFFLQVPDAAPALGPTHVVVRRANGELVLDMTRVFGAEPNKGGTVGAIAFGAGYGGQHIDVTAQDGRSASADFVVSAGDEPRVGVTLELAQH